MNFQTISLKYHLINKQYLGFTFAKLPTWNTNFELSFGINQQIIWNIMILYYIIWSKYNCIIRQTNNTLCNKIKVIKENIF